MAKKKSKAEKKAAKIEKKQTGKKTKVGKIIKGAGKTVKALKALGEFAALKPFEGLMKKQLNSRKIAHTNKLDDIATKFFHNVVKPNPQHYEQNHLGEEVAGGIIKAIIDFIKSIKSKKDAGKTLTPAETEILSAADTVAADVKAAGIESAESTLNTFFKKNWIFIAAVIILLIVFVAKKR